MPRRGGPLKQPRDRIDPRREPPACASERTQHSRRRRRRRNTPPKSDAKSRHHLRVKRFPRAAHTKHSGTIAARHNQAVVADRGEPKEPLIRRPDQPHIRLSQSRRGSCRRVDERGRFRDNGSHDFLHRLAGVRPNLSNIESVRLIRRRTERPNDRAHEITAPGSP
ncbi:hypothetical protein ACFPRL_27015 [Pseudoclavibacter helvolus]